MKVRTLRTRQALFPGPLIFKLETLLLGANTLKVQIQMKDRDLHIHPHHFLRQSLMWSNLALSQSVTIQSGLNFTLGSSCLHQPQWTTEILDLCQDALFYAVLGSSPGPPVRYCKVGRP